MSELLENRYQIIRELAEGGFGKTFIAEDTQMPSHRRCVIKQLKPMGEGSQIFELIKERFQREAVILEDLGNNNGQIPSLFAHFSSEGKFYLVQEYIEGETLAERVLKQGKLSESAVKEILIKLLTVLDFVHSKRIIHRDIKPENIILRSGDDTPVLIDFGAVREIMGTVMTPTGNSTRSIVIGTPGYMPSEQLAGRPMFTSDLYALALTLIYALTSKMPSEFATDPQTGNIMWLQDAFSVSPTLANVLERAIVFNPNERWQSARTMLQGLQGQTAASTILADENINYQKKPAETIIADVPIPPPLPTEIAPPVYPNNSTVIQGNNNAPNNNLMVIIIGLLILIGFGGLGFFMYQQNQQYQAQMAKLEADRKKAEEEKQKAEEERKAKEAELVQQQQILAEESRLRQEAEIQRQQEAARRQAAEATARQQQASLILKATNNNSNYSIPYRPTCGDSYRSGETWYAVNGPYAALSTVKSNYCGDAYKKSQSIQVASFTDYNRAQEFAAGLTYLTGFEFVVKESNR